jgi:hypothetical protein
VTVFSAPDYPQFQPDDEPRHNNRASVLRLRPNDPTTYDIITFSAVPRPAACPFYDTSAPGSDDEMMLTAFSSAPSDVSEHASVSGASDGSDFLAASLSAGSEVHSLCSSLAHGASKGESLEACTHDGPDCLKLSNHTDSCEEQGSGMSLGHVPAASAQMHTQFPEGTSPRRCTESCQPAEACIAGSQQLEAVHMVPNAFMGKNESQPPVASLPPETEGCMVNSDVLAEDTQIIGLHVLEAARTHAIPSSLIRDSKGWGHGDGQPCVSHQTEEQRTFAHCVEHRKVDITEPELTQRCLEAANALQASALVPESASLDAAKGPGVVSRPAVTASEEQAVSTCQSTTPCRSGGHTLLSLNLWQCNLSCECSQRPIMVVPAMALHVHITQIN